VRLESLMSFANIASAEIQIFHLADNQLYGALERLVIRETHDCGSFLVHSVECALNGARGVLIANSVADKHLLLTEPHAAIIRRPTLYAV